MVSSLAFDGLFLSQFFLGFLLFCFLALTMLPFISFFSLSIKMIKKEVHYERCAFHLTQLGVFLGLVFSGIFLCMIAIYWKNIQVLSPVLTCVFWLLCLLFFFGVFISLIIFNFWKQLSRDPLLQVVFVTFPGVFFSIVVISLIFLIGYAVSGELSALQTETDLRVLIKVFFPSITNPLWLVVIAVHFIEAAAAGSIALLWLWFRRNKDNFGRDYYMFAAKYCSEWTAYGAWVSWINFVILSYVKFHIVANVWSVVVFTFSLILLSAVLWTIIAISKTPMRHKIAMICSIIFYVYAGLQVEKLFLQ